MSSETEEPMAGDVLGDRRQVVVNHEEQYSTWEADREPPEGWRPTGFTGTKDECLAHIAEVWTDLRPLSARVSHR